jgi:hypothetical protein
MSSEMRNEAHGKRRKRSDNAKEHGQGKLLGIPAVADGHSQILRPKFQDQDSPWCRIPRAWTEVDDMLG